MNENEKSQLIEVPPLPTLEWNAKHAYCWYGVDRLPVDGLSAVIGPPTIHLGDNKKEPGAPGTLGFAFDCAWDEEHQLSVLVGKGEVVEIGDGSVAGHIRE